MLFLLTLLALPALAGSSPQQLEKLLSDPSYDVRRNALEGAEEDIAKNPALYKDQLRLALRVEPPSVRQEAVEIISELPKEIRNGLVDAVKVCAKDDQHPVVKTGCQRLLKTSDQ